MTAQNGLKVDASGRQHVRTNMRVHIKLLHESVGEISVHTDNMSDSGIFIIQADGMELPGIGEMVTIQVQDMPVEAPQIEAEVVRVTKDGIGLRFTIG